MWKNEALPVVEDCIEYHIYDKNDEDNLTLKCSNYNALISELTKNHIWQVIILFVDLQIILILSYF